MSDTDASAQPVLTVASRAARSRVDATARAARIARARELEKLSNRFLGCQDRVAKVFERSEARRVKFEEAEGARVAGELEAIEARSVELLAEAGRVEGVSARELRDYFGISRKEAAALLACGE